MTSLMVPAEVSPVPSLSASVRKTSSGDFISTSALPRSRSSSFGGSIYADAIRRQRSDTFVHAQQQKYRKSQFYKNAIKAKSAASASAAAAAAAAAAASSSSSTNTRHSTRIYSTESDSESEDGGEDEEGSSHDAISINSEESQRQLGPGAILEGVMRRAVRPSHPQQSREILPEKLMAVETRKEPSQQKSQEDLGAQENESHSWQPPPFRESPKSATFDKTSLPSPSLEKVESPTTPNSKNSKVLFLSGKKKSTHKDKDDHSSFKPHSIFHFSRFNHKHEHAKQPLYDDGSHAVYPPPPSAEDKDNEDTIDRYGFKVVSQWVSFQEYNNFEKIYRPTLDRRLSKWHQLLEENGTKLPERSPKVRRYVRKGIPADLRGRVWFHYSGAEAKLDSNLGVYERFLAKARELGSKNEFADIIERDLHRTFPENVQFRTPVVDGQQLASTDNVPVISALRRVLLAFSIYCPSVGYCQSLNFIVGMLLLFMKEEEAFWTLVTIIQNILPAGVYDVTMEGSNLDQNVLMMLLWERMPQLWGTMCDKSFWESEADGVSMPTITLVTSHWFLTLFINILPTETLLRVWDCFFYEGANVLFRMALTLFKMSEHMVMSLGDSLEIFQVIQNLPKKSLNCQTLLDVSEHRLKKRTIFADLVFDLIIELLSSLWIPNRNNK
ncbi:rab-GTPase-TBC domain-containing protein [Phycomyces nitens]|nr:rab-GTPase-TBC domain-containing protein [Phycomyces nitens]